jgi:hypothetical protein
MLNENVCSQYRVVNGAGLAMNTVDALTIHGGHCANFLDTGGKATSETVKASFRVICSDTRVKAVFVNIFGGLTRCDMIAEGIILAFRDLNMKVPVVVRLRGTNEELGQKMVSIDLIIRYQCLVANSDVCRLRRVAFLCMHLMDLRRLRRRPSRWLRLNRCLHFVVILDICVVALAPVK